MESIASPLVESEQRFSYAAFLSYSHAADDKLAPAIQSALHKLAKPWYRMRSVKVFRDKTSLSANPALWPAIVEALAASRYFLLMASPGAAASPWVRQEVNWWKENRSRDRLLILATDGEICWDNEAHDFDWNVTTCLPPALHGYFSEEPTWVDFRWARSGESPSLRHAQFRAAVLDLAAPLHGRAKDELDGDDVRQHRRVQQIAWAIGAVMVILTVISVLAASRAIQQSRIAQQQRNIAEQRRQESERQRNIAEQRRQEAERERNIALGRQLSSDAALVRNEHPAEYELAALLLVEAARRSLPFENDNDLRDTLTRVPVFEVDRKKPVNAVAFSPDSRMLVIAGWDGRLRTFDTVHWKPRWEARADQNTLSFSRDGRMLAGGGGDSEVTWDAATGREFHRTSRKGIINAFAVNTDATLSATAVHEGGLFLTDLKTGKERQLPGNGPSDALAFSPDGALLAAVIIGQVQLFDAMSGENLRSLGRSIQKITFSPDSKLLVAADSEKTVQVYSVADGKLLHEIVLEQGGNSIAFNRDGSLLAIGSGDRSAQIYRMPSIIKAASFSHPDFVDSVDFSPDSQYLVSTTTNDKTVRIWRSGQNGEVMKLPHRESVLSIAMSPDGRYLATGSPDGRARVFQMEQTAKPLVIVHPDKIVKVIFSPDGQRAVTGCLDGVARILDRSNGREVRRSGHANSAKELAFSGDGRLLVVGSGDGGARVIETASGREVNLPGNKYAVNKVALNSDATFVATAGQDQNASVYDSATGRRKLQFKFSDPVNVVGFQPAGKLLLAATYRGVFLCDLKTGVCPREPMPGLEQIFQFSPNGKWGAFGAKSGVVLRDSQSWQEIGRIDQPSPPEAMAISPDARFIASQYRRTIEILDIANHILVGRIDLRDEINGFAFSPDSRMLYTASGTPRLMLQEHMLRTEDLVSEICRRLDRNLTPVEWKKYVGDEPYRETCKIGISR